MANADTTSDILLNAGFTEVELHRCDIPILIGRDLDHAVEFVTALGPAGEVIRLPGDEAEKIRPQIEAALREALAEFEEPKRGHRQRLDLDRQREGAGERFLVVDWPVSQDRRFQVASASRLSRTIRREQTDGTS